MAGKFSKPFTWDPADYAASSAQQQAWARELIGRLHLRGSERLLDVGCGDGKVTAELARALPRGAVTGIDSSPEMIRFAREKFPASSHPNLDFRVMDARQIHLAREFELVFSNAALHWVDDHRAFLKGAAACMRSGGRLVLSCGGHGNAQDVFVALRGAMRLKRWREFFRGLERPYFFHHPEEYKHWLPQQGFTPSLVRLAEKDMTFVDARGLAAWLRTAWLPYTQRVPEHARAEFITGVTERYLARHPLDAASRAHVRMVRLEIEAIRN